MLSSLLPLIGFLGFVTLGMFFFFISRYKRCPPDKILVVFGKLGEDEPIKCYLGGAVFVIPIFQDYKYLDLTVIDVEVDHFEVLPKQKINAAVPTKFNVGISQQPGLMVRAAQRLLGLSQSDIRSIAHDIIKGQMRLVIENTDLEKLSKDRDKFTNAVYMNVGNELNKIGLQLINVNI